MTEICNAIDAAQVLVCDLTNLNENVLFEYGYAIAQNKTTWILRDPSVEQSQKDFERFQLLTTVGYRAYTCSRDIVKQFYEDRPFDDFRDTMLEQVQRSRNLALPGDTILYVKCPITTEASRIVTAEVQRRYGRTRVNVVVDDPREEPARSLQWYASYCRYSRAVLVHFLEQDRFDSRFHNAKAAFVSGLALGFGNRLLMLAAEPYDTPIDYRDILKRHKTARQAQTVVSDWIGGTLQDLQQVRTKVRAFDERKRRGVELRELILGDPIAENEASLLPDYFVETSAYRDALAANYLFLVGRRGCGKTALALRLAEELGGTRSKHACLVQPRDYDLQGVLDIFDRLSSEYDFGSAADSLWRVLLYTELARSVESELGGLPPGAATENEKSFLDSLDEWRDLLAMDFTARLERFAGRIDEYRLAAGDGKADVREVLFGSILPGLRDQLKLALDRSDGVTLIVDNLDKAWKPEAYTELLRDLLLGLMRVSGEIIGEFARRDYRGVGVSLSVLVFLRSDIFIRFLDVAKERDKITMRRMAWEDPETLLRVIAERFIASAPEVANSPRDVWAHYFCESVDGQAVPDFLVSSVLPRPRDLIYLASAAVDLAVDRGRDTILAEDLTDARYEYSRNAFFSVVDEGRTRFEEAESLLFEFLGAKEIVSMPDIAAASLAAGIPESDLPDVVALLCDLTFLGPEVDDDQFTYVYDYRDRSKLKLRAEGYATRSGAPARFLINSPFHPYLEITRAN